MSFKGFDEQVWSFYAGLEANNNRPYWLEHKDFYDRNVKGALLELAEALGDRFQPAHVFRPNRDVRFSRDKSPYKTQAGAVHEREGGAINYVQVSASGLFVATGFYMLAKDQLERFRASVADDDHGPQFVELVQQVQQARLTVGPGGDPPLKRAPRGIAADHPRVEWLRWKGAIAAKDFGRPQWVHRPQVVARIIESWEAAEPLNQWLEQHVGPSSEPPDEVLKS